MVRFEKTADGEGLVVSFGSRLDAFNAPLLEDELEKRLPGVSNVTFDLANLEYISSAGLRVMLWTQKSLGGNGAVVVTNPSEVVREIFAVTRFDNFITIIQ